MKNAQEIINSISPADLANWRNNIRINGLPDDTLIYYICDNNTYFSARVVNDEVSKITYLNGSTFANFYIRPEPEFRERWKGATNNGCYTCMLIDIYPAKLVPSMAIDGRLIYISE